MRARPSTVVHATPATPFDREAWPLPPPVGVLKRRSGFGTVLGMARPLAQGVAARAARREEARLDARRARILAALLVAACVAVVTLVLTAFESESSAPVDTGPAPAQRLLPAGPPEPQVVAMHETLRIQLPIHQSHVTAIGYHASGTGAFPLEPVGTQANAGVLGRIWRSLFGGSGSDLRYYLLDGGVGPRTGGIDVGAPVDTDVYTPVDGTVIAISDHVVNGQRYGVRIDVQPSGNPGVVVSVSNLRADPALTVGSTVSSGRTKVGRLIDLTRVERAGLARYTRDNGQHVHLEVRTATSLAAP